MTKTFEPPSHLTAESQELWRQLVPSRARSVGRLELLRAALEAKDRANQATLELAKATLTTETKTTGAVHLHPLLRVEREARDQFAKFWGQLGLSFDQSVDGSSFERWNAQQVDAAIQATADFEREVEQA